MAKMIGLSRALKPEWLNKTAESVLEGMSADDIKAILNEYISFEISSKDNIRKTRDILLNLWVYPFKEESANSIRAMALDALRDGCPDMLAMHWCMLLLYYPVFVDVTGTIGALSSMQDSFSLTWLKGKMFEQWGERTTMVNSIPKIMQTLRQLGVVRSEKGACKIERNIISSDQTKIILIKTALTLGLKSYYEPSELAVIPQMFPFEYDVTSEIIFGSNAFEFGNFGGSPVVIK